MSDEDAVVSVPMKKSSFVAPPVSSLSDRVQDYLGAVPPILACSAAAYLLNFSGCVSSIGKTLPEGLNVSYHLAAGAGLYGGYTKNSHRKLTSLAMLCLSMAPEVVLAVDGNIKNAGAAMGVKALGYGLGYIVGKFFS